MIEIALPNERPRRVEVISEVQMVGNQMMSRDPVSMAIEYMNANKPRAAKKLLRSVLSSRPNHPDANHILGVIELRAGKLEQAKKRISRAIKANPELIYAHNNLGEVFRAQGRLDKAAACYRKVLAIDPDMSEAQNNLGIVLEELGESEEAIDCYRKAAALNPDDPETLQNLATALQRIGRLDEAATCLHDTLAVDPKLANVHNNLGIVLQKLNLLDEAIASFRSAIEISPSLIGAYNNLAQALRTLGRYPEAIANYEKALALAPANVDIHYSLANAVWDSGEIDDALAIYEKALWAAPNDAENLRVVAGAYMEAGRMTQAIDYYQKAIAIKPGLAKAHNDLGNLYERLNDLEKAGECVQKALKIAPDDPAANLSHAVLLKRGGETDKAIETLESFTDRDTPGEMLSQIHYELGKLYDLKKDTGKAFHNFTVANDLRAQSEDSASFKKDAFLAEVKRTEQILTADWVASWANAEDEQDSESLAFIVGFPRSGTTLLDQILDSHPAIQVMEEKEVIHHDIIGEITARHGDHNSAVAQLGASDIESLRKSYFESVGRHIDRKPGNLLVDKFPLNIRHLPLINRLFPDARIILALRHPCDVVLSNFMQNFKLNNAMANFLTIADAAHCFAQVMGLWQKSAALLPMNHHTLSYESLVADFESEVRQLLEFLEVGWDDAVLEYDRHARQRGVINTPSYQSVTEPVYQRAKYRWKRYQENLAPIYDDLLPFIEAFGYSERNK